MVFTMFRSYGGILSSLVHGSESYSLPSPAGNGAFSDATNKSSNPPSTLHLNPPIPASSHSNTTSTLKTINLPIGDTLTFRSFRIPAPFDDLSCPHPGTMKRNHQACGLLGSWILPLPWLSPAQEDHRRALWAYVSNDGTSDIWLGHCYSPTFRLSVL